MSHLLLLQSVFGLMCVCFGTSEEPSWKQCKKEKIETNYFTGNIVNCTYKGFKTIPKDAFEFKNAKYM